LRGGLFYRNAAEIRTEMDRIMPLYKGIARLEKKGDWVQYGGPRLLEGGVCPKMPGGRARFSPLDLPSGALAKEGLPADLSRLPRVETRGAQPREALAKEDPPGQAAHTHFRLTTRRGSQFNSMIFDSVDPLTGARRDDVILSPHDAARLNLAAGDRIRLRSEVGEFTGRARLGEVAQGCLVALWPEANVLLSRRYDPGSGEPDYNAEVTLEKT
jgi:anaerobic selenocysteine-containing dehydrogenase